MSDRRTPLRGQELEDSLKKVHERLFRLENPGLGSGRMSLNSLQLGNVMISVTNNANPNGQDVVFRNLTTGTTFIISL